MKKYNWEEDRFYSISEETEERLYSTGNSDLDDLLEKAFCDGYEYAQREFASKEERAARKEYRKDTRKLNKEMKDAGMGSLDRADVNQYRGYKEETREMRKRLHSEDRETRDAANKENMKKFYPLSAGLTGVLGAAEGLSYDGNPKHAAIGAAAGVGLGLGEAALIDHYNTKRSRKAEENPEGRTAKKYEEYRDIMKVGDREMTPEEFKDKWGD